MKKFETREEAFASQNYDPLKVVIEGIPPHIVEAAKGFINLCVAHDAVNPEFKPDFTNWDQYKYNALHEMGSPSGAGFAYHDCANWNTVSDVGARLVSESREAGEHIAELFDEDYKAMKVYDRKVE